MRKVGEVPWREVGEARGREVGEVRWRKIGEVRWREVDSLLVQRYGRRGTRPATDARPRIS